MKYPLDLNKKKKPKQIPVHSSKSRKQPHARKPAFSQRSIGTVTACLLSRTPILFRKPASTNGTRGNRANGSGSPAAKCKAISVSKSHLKGIWRTKAIESCASRKNQAQAPVTSQGKSLLCPLRSCQPRGGPLPCLGHRWLRGGSTGAASSSRGCPAPPDTSAAAIP